VPLSLHNETVDLRNVRDKRIESVGG